MQGFQSEFGMDQRGTLPLQVRDFGVWGGLGFRLSGSGFRGLGWKIGVRIITDGIPLWSVSKYSVIAPKNLPKPNPRGDPFEVQGWPLSSPSLPRGFRV